MFKNLTQLQKEYFYVVGIISQCVILALVIAPVSVLAFSVAGFAAVMLAAVIFIQGVDTLKPVKTSK